MNAKMFHKTIPLMMVSMLLAACASERERPDDQSVEPPFQQRVSECARIGDRGERNRCLYENQFL